MNKKADIMWNTIIKILLLVVCLFFLFSAGCTLYTSLTGSQQEDMLKDQLDIFAAQINALTYSSQNYTSMPMFLTLKQNDCLVAFDSATFSEYLYIDFISNSQKVIKKPSVCGVSSCLCVYSNCVEEDFTFDKPFYCVNLDVDYIIASPLYQFLGKIKYKILNAHPYLEGVIDDFYGGKYYLSSDKINNIFLKNLGSKAKVLTHNLGFSDEYYYLVLEFEEKEGVPYADSLFYLELFQNRDLKMLMFHPYSSILNNRKYYFTKSKGIGYCNNKFLHESIPQTNGKYTYCKQGSFGLIESKEEYEKCSIGYIEKPCICGHRLISSGFCGLSDSTNAPLDILINPFTKIMCSESILNTEVDYCNKKDYSVYCLEGNKKVLCNEIES